MRNSAVATIALLAVLASLAFAQEFAQYALLYDGPEVLRDFGWNDRVWCASEVHDRVKWKCCLEENLPVGIGPYFGDEGIQTVAQPSQPIESKSSKGTAVLPIEVGTIGGKPYFTTNLALGEPAQAFRVVFDLISNGLYVRSSSCAYDECGPQDFSYNGSLSRTRQSLGNKFELLPDGWVVQGNISEETVHLTGIKVANATFGEITGYHGPNLYYYVLSYVVDG